MSDWVGGPGSEPDHGLDGALGDPAAEEAVLALASSIADLVGFAECGVAVLSSEGDLVDLAFPRQLVATPPGRRSLEQWVGELESATPLGALFVVPGTEIGTGQGTIPAARTASAVTGPRVVVALHDSQHDFVGFMWFAGFRAGGAPPSEHAGGALDAERLATLEKLSGNVGQVVALAVRRRRQRDQVRLVAASRAVVRGASRELDIEVIMQQVGPPLVAGFQAVGLWLMVFSSATTARTSVHAETGGPGGLPPLTEAQGSTVRRVAEYAWAQQRVGIVSRERLRGGLLSDDEVVEVRGVLTATGTGSLLMIPIGVGPECLGGLVLARRADDPVWSEPELDAALDLGHDLGRALLNARSHQRERGLVAELKEESSRRTRLIRTLSHEIKSPLTAILANLELVEELDEVSLETASGVSGARRGALRLTRVVEDMLTLAANGDYDVPVRTGPVDMVHLVEEAAELKRAEAEQAGITVAVSAPTPRAVVVGDARALELLVANLVSNALKYNRRGGRVDLRVETVDQYVVLTCADQGIGMIGDDVSRVFDEFFRSSDPDARAQPGTGLGLAIVDRIVRRHAGTVTVASEAGRGTTFRVQLPADAASTTR